MTCSIICHFVPFLLILYNLFFFDLRLLITDLRLLITLLRLQTLLMIDE